MFIYIHSNIFIYIQKCNFFLKSSATVWQLGSKVYKLSGNVFYIPKLKTELGRLLIPKNLYYFYFGQNICLMTEILAAIKFLKQ